MAINKVVYGTETLIDLTTDNVTAETLAEGSIAHGADGERIIGKMVPVRGEPVEVYQDANGDIVVSGASGSTGTTSPLLVTTDSNNNILLDGDVLLVGDQITPSNIIRVDFMGYPSDEAFQDEYYPYLVEYSDGTNLIYACTDRTQNMLRFAKVNDDGSADVISFTKSIGAGVSATWNRKHVSNIGSDVPTDEISANTSARHTHTNKSVIDSITQAQVETWDGLNSRVLTLETNGGSSSSSGSSGFGNGAFASLEDFGGVAGDSSATARTKNTQAITNAILAGFNIRCDSRNTAVDILKTYFFSGWCDVRAIKYRSIDIDLNGCRFCDFHIIANIIPDSEMTESYCSWGWNNGNKFTLKIHDGLIGATSAGSTMTSLPDDPIAVTGLIPNFYNLQLLGSAHLLAMPPVYCDQLYMDNIKVNCNNASQWTYWADTYECISVIRGKDSSGNYIYKNNGTDSKGVNGDQFTFSRLNDCRNFFTVWNNLGTSIRNCISSSFGINQSMVEMTLCHSESELLYSIVGGTQTTVIFNQCYFNQDQIDIFRTVSANTQKMMTFNDCVVRVGNIGGNHNVALEPEAFGFMLNASGTLKLHTMGRTIVGGRAINPPRVFCTASTISTAENASAGGIKTADGTNQKLGAYHYIVGLHSTNKVNVAHTKIEADVTYSSQFSLYRLALSNYCGQRIIMYKSDSSGNKYRCIIDSYNINGNLYLDDCGSFVSVWTYDVTFPTSTGRVSDGYAWEKVTSIPTITTNTTLRQSGDLIYDTNGKIYTVDLTAIN